METVWKSIHWREKHKHWIKNNWNIGIGMICAFPGSHIYKNACARGIIKDRIKFLHDGYPPVNISKMTDDEYYALPALINSLISVADKIKNANVSPQSDYTANISGQCPYCLNTISFSNFEGMFYTGKLNCDICGKEIVLNPIEFCDFNEMGKNLETLANGNVIAVWAVTQYNYIWLLRALPMLEHNNIRFINSNEVIVGKHTISSLGGKKLYTPDIINEEQIDTILVPNVPSVFQEIKDICAKDFPSVKRVVHITELM